MTSESKEERLARQVRGAQKRYATKLKSGERRRIVATVDRDTGEHFDNMFDTLRQEIIDNGFSESYAARKASGMLMEQMIDLVYKQFKKGRFKPEANL